MVPTGTSPCCQTLPFAFSDQLDPGHYRLSIEGTAMYAFVPFPFGLARIAYDVSLDFAPSVPALGAGGQLLLAIGLIAAASKGRAR